MNNLFGFKERSWDFSSPSMTIAKPQHQPNNYNNN